MNLRFVPAVRLSPGDQAEAALSFENDGANGTWRPAWVGRGRVAKATLVSVTGAPTLAAGGHLTMSGADSRASLLGAERFEARADTNAAVLRPAHARDQEGAFTLLTGAALPLGGVAERFPEGYVVATVGERLVGLAAVERYERSGLLRSVAVAAELRSSGLGARLVADALAQAKREGLDEVYLLTTTAPGFFRKLGFREVERSGVPGPVRASAEFASICPASAVCMALCLGAP